MDLNIPKLNNLFELTDTNIKGHFILDGKQYEIERFQINFGQEVDHKGQPQHETQGGQFIIAMSQSVDDNIYDWAKRPGKRKNCEIRFTTESSGTVNHIEFTDAVCISLTHKINIYSGTETMMVITPRIVTIDGYVEHNNGWRE